MAKDDATMSCGLTVNDSIRQEIRALRQELRTLRDEEKMIIADIKKLRMELHGDKYEDKPE